MLKIVAVGDIMPGGLLSITNTEFATAEVRGFLASGDLRVGNFECAIEVENPGGKKYKAGGNTIFCREKDAERVKDLGIDIVSIANNHLFDLGPEGAFKAIEVLDELGIKHCGAGRNLVEAQKPVVVNWEGKTFAFLAFADTRLDFMYEASEATPGVNPLHEEYVLSQISNAYCQFDYVIVIPHWGKENTYFPTFEVELLSKKMIEAGACLVLGGHPHRIQPVVNYYHRKSVVYSMGNFLFSNRIINVPRYTWYPKEPIDISTLPRTIGCPLVDTPTIKLWRPLAYIGMMVKCKIEGNRIRTRLKLTYTNMDNCVEILKKGKLRQHFILKLLGITIKLGMYKATCSFCDSYLKGETWFFIKLKKCQKVVKRAIAFLGGN